MVCLALLLEAFGPQQGHKQIDEQGHRNGPGQHVEPSHCGFSIACVVGWSLVASLPERASNPPTARASTARPAR
eukprot:43085-Eustigmatos_ZCMA.PRE.1